MRKTLLFALTACLLTACYYRTDTPRGSWAKGCDLSWLSEMEHDSVFAYDCMAALHERGMNAVRLRVWSTMLPAGATRTIWSHSPNVQPNRGYV